MSNWHFMHPFAIRGADGSLYLWRLRIVQTPWFAVYLHAIHRPDHDSELHDHPWDFVSFVLRGGYAEQMLVRGGSANWMDWRTVRWFNVKRAESAHRIIHLRRTPTWTLVFCGRRRREWGFYTRTGWTPWHEFLAGADTREKATVQP